MIDQCDFEDLVHQNVPMLFLRQLADGLPNCYGECRSLKDTYGLHAELDKWARPFVRRAIIETFVYELACRFPQLTTEMRHSSNGMAYLAIEAGPLILTVAKVEKLGALPDESEYRCEHSFVNYSLYADQENLPAGGPLYVILSHIPDPSGHQPAHINLLLPDGAYTRVLHSIDLRDWCSGGDYQDPTPVSPSPNPQPTLKPQQGKEQEK